MLAKRSTLAKISTPELRAQYKAACKQSVELSDKIAVMRAELNARNAVADAEAKLDAAKAEYAAGEKALDAPGVDFPRQSASNQAAVKKGAK